MKRFEILNDRWIKQLNIKNIVSDYSTTTSILYALKISSITHINASSNLANGYLTFSISLGTDGCSFYFEYNKDEENEFKNDLSFFENLLFPIR